MSSAATWMYLESVILRRKSDRERKISYDIGYLLNLKRLQMNLTYKTEIELQMQKTKYGYQAEQGEG